MEEIQNHLINVLYKNGYIIKLNVVGVPVYNRENISEIYIMAHDLSYPFKLENKLMKTTHTFYEFYNHINIAIFLCIPDEKSRFGTILEANQYACRMLGYEYNELVNMPFKKIVYINHSGMTSFFTIYKEFSTFRTVFITKQGEKQSVSLFSHLTNLDEKKLSLQ